VVETRKRGYFCVFYNEEGFVYHILIREILGKGGLKSFRWEDVIKLI